MEERELGIMPYDKSFNNTLCHATGVEVHFDGDEPWDWWNEYIDDDGNFHYGR